MAQPQPTPNHHHNQNCDEGELSESVAVFLIERIESYRNPKKLYGRDQDLETISTVYNRFIEQLRQYDDTKDVNSSEFILVHGETGSGKSALIQHFFMNNSNQPLMATDHQCFCILGEFDHRINLRTPNAAFIDALTSYVHQVKERKLVDKIRNALQQSSLTKDEIEVLIQIIPMFSELFERPESPTAKDQQYDENVARSLSMPISNDSISVFKFALLKFLRVVATKTHPIIRMLEDMHRADESGLNLLTFLMNHTNTNAILFVGTTRDDMNSESLEIMFKKLSSHETVVTHVHLYNLETHSTMTMISDVLDMVDRNLLHAILEIINNQSMCNPYGILTFLSKMVQNGCLIRDKSENPMWQSSPKKMQYFNNKSIYDVIYEQLALLPANVLQSLRFAALFDTKIDMEILSQLMNTTQSEMVAFLKIAADNGFLTSRSSGDFMFMHEYISETLLQSIPVDEQEELHYKVGRRLWQWYDLEKLDENILVVVRLLLVGKRHIMKDRERVAVAKLCLRAGEQLVHMSSFRSAYRYVMHGIDLGGKDCWKCEYQVALDLHNAAAELAYCTGNGSEALEISNTIALEARCFDDALTGHDIKIRALGAVGKVKESIDFGLSILSKLDESFPINPSIIRTFIAFQIIRHRVKGRTSESLLRLPLMTDQRKAAAVKIMNQLFNGCIQLNPLMAALVAFRVVSLTLDFGISATSCLGFVTLGALLGGPAQDIDEAYRLGRVGMAMYEKFKIKVWLAPLYIMYFLGIHSFKHELSSNIEPMRYAAHVGEETGNIEESITCELFLSFVQLETRSLLKSVNSMNEIRKKMLFYGLTTIHELSTPTLQSLQTLIGYRDISSITTYQQSDGVIFLFTHFHIMMLSLIFGDVDTAAISSTHLRAFSAYPFGGVDAAFIVFFDGLTAIRLARRERKWQNINYGMKKVKQLTIYAAHAPALFLCRLYLLEAEIASILGNHFAYPKYVSAIALAKDSGSLTVASLGHESAGRYCFNEKQDYLAAKMHFQEAIYFYEMWGATAKVTQLTTQVRCMFGEIKTFQ